MSSIDSDIERNVPGPTDQTGDPLARDAAAKNESASPDDTYPSWLDELTPRNVVAELDKYIVGQEEAKKAVAIALRNRWRRQRAPDDLRDEIMPNNIILIGPTGVGKTEIARRLARLVGAPFVKVEASKFTEVGYVGRDVESVVRDLVDVAVNMVRAEREEDVQELADQRVEERLMDLLIPPVREESAAAKGATRFVAGPKGVTEQAQIPAAEPPRDSAPSAERNVEEQRVRARRDRTREKLRKLLQDGKLEDRLVELEVQQSPVLDGFTVPAGGMEGMDFNVMEWLQDMLPKRTKRRTVTVAEARRILLQDELDRLVDMDDVVNEALDRVEQMGIVFLDEIDKIAAPSGTTGIGPDVSREGVQRDLLPIVEGCTVQTKYGFVRTDHVLFVAAGAFHVAKPSDLIPELQGRFPIRVELKTLTEQDFIRILTEPKNALIRQYQALVAAEGAELIFEDDGIHEIARIAGEVNERMENIGARRLHTVLTTLLDQILYDLPDGGDRRLVVTRQFVRERLSRIAENEDLRRYIL